NRLDAKVRAFFEDQIKSYEDKMWATLKRAMEEADNCNSAKQPCTLGKLAKISIVPVQAGDAESHKKLVERAVLAGWARRCGADCVREWNETVGKTLGLEAPLAQ
ncbi:MAG TPA: hypothetical protein VE665_03585, partial [Hyphomicrobiaceae bacterium]|nr:hypothetical protein [Hyphomicrobiaceae bacterium]